MSQSTAQSASREHACPVSPSLSSTLTKHLPPKPANCTETSVVSKAQVTLVITVSSGQVMHEALNLCRVNPEASQHEIQNPWKDEGVRMCWTKKKIDSNYQLLHCIFHRSHHFQQELQKKSREPGISKQLITSRISKEQTALQQEIKSFKVVRSAPWLYTTSKRPVPPQNAHTGSIQIARSLATRFTPGGAVIR